MNIMMAFEQEQQTLQDLCAIVETDSEVDSDIDKISENDHVSVKQWTNIMTAFEKEQQALRDHLAIVETDSEVDDSDSEVDKITGSDHETESEQEADDTSALFEIPSLMPEKFYFGRDGTKWCKMAPPKNVQPRLHNITTHIPGVKKAYRNLKTPIECFEQIFDDKIMEHLVKSTNIYISKMRINYSRERDAQNTNITELKALFGLLYYAGILRGAHLNAKDLWATDGCGMQIFQGTMSIKRFHFLLRCIRFDDMNSQAERKKTDRLAPIRNIFEILTKNMQEIYSLSEYCTVDEKLEPFRGNCQFRQYIKNKPAKCGIKIFALCDAKTFYTYNLEIYVGQQPIGPYRKSNSAIDVVKRIISPISGTGRNLTMDNWFMSIPLACDLLKDHKLTCIGTLHKDKQEIPPEFLPHKSRPINSSLFGFKDNTMTLTSYVPKKSKVVLVVSTLHENNKIDPSSGDQFMPEMITFYNLTKGSVAVLDELCRTYSVSRRCRRWPLAVFFGLMDIAGINAFIIHHDNNSESVNMNLNRKSFLKDLALALVKDHLIVRSTFQSLSNEYRIGIKRLAGIEDVQPKKFSKRASGRCDVCPRRDDRKTSVSCSKCNKLICKKHAVILCEECLENNV